MQFTNIIALVSVLSATAMAAPQIDAGCTASCGIWNGCRVRNAITGTPLTECGAEPPRCNCTQFASAGKAALDAPAKRQIDAGCTASCGIWNGCRVRNAITGAPLTECGAEPARCNCTQFASAGKEALDAPAKRQIDAGCTASCGIWNGCRVRNAITGAPLTECGAEPARCNCTQFASAGKEALDAPAKRQIDAGCTASCGIWNGCRVRNAITGAPLTECGAEPARCNCTQFASAGKEALDAPAKRQIDAGCTASCGIWNGCRVRNAITGTPLTECGAEPPRCNCTQFASAGKEALDQSS